MTEKEAAAFLEFYQRELGASGTSFSIIVASGVRSSLPHGQPTDKKLAQGDFVTFDFGAVYGGYCSDMTRTIVMGEANEQQKKIYHIVLEAQQAALSLLRPGLSCREGDRAARDIITGEGYGKFFGHGTGHSLGLAIHEEPRLSPFSEDVLAPGVVMTVEPGIYIPGWGGVRIEDVAVITETGARILTGAPKELIELNI
jgi:Xaa-Pro aminopeptidase